MNLKVDNDRLMFLEEDKDNLYLDEKGRTQAYQYEIGSITLQKLAKALKPYLDSIDNCECKKVE